MFDVEGYAVVLGAGGKLGARGLSPYLERQKIKKRDVGRWIGVDLNDGGSIVADPNKTLNGYDNFVGGFDVSERPGDWDGGIRTLIRNARVVYNAVMFPFYKWDDNLSEADNKTNLDENDEQMRMVHVGGLRNLLEILDGSDVRLIQFSSNNVHEGYLNIKGLDGSTPQNPPLDCIHNRAYNSTKAEQNVLIQQVIENGRGPKNAVIFDISWPMPEDELDKVLDMGVEDRKKLAKVHPDVFGEFMLKAGLMPDSKIFRGCERIFRCQLVHPYDFSPDAGRNGWIDMSEPIERFDYNPERRFALSGKNFSKD